MGISLTHIGEASGTFLYSVYSNISTDLENFDTHCTGGEKDEMVDIESVTFFINIVFVLFLFIRTTGRVKKDKYDTGIANMKGSA